MINITNSPQHSGIKVGTYAPEVQQGKPGAPPQQIDRNPIIGYIEPAGRTARWIAWFSEQGDLFVYSKRDATGGIIGEPVEFHNNRLVDGPDKQYVMLKDDDDLFVHGKATDHIWTMEDKEGFIGVRFDCGDSGTLYLSRDQATDLLQQLGQFLGRKID